VCGNDRTADALAGSIRVAEYLRQNEFLNIELVKPKKGAPGADLLAERNGERICWEVKAITKQSNGRSTLFFADQLYEKVLENVAKAVTQLEATATELQCSVKIFTCVVNWFEQSIYLGEDDYQGIVNRLERDQKSLEGVDGVLFLTKFGQSFLFMNEAGSA
jgi:hypothetical protein